MTPAKELRTYLFAIGAICLTIALCAAVETQFDKMQGLVTLTVDVLFELLAAWSVLANPHVRARLGKPARTAFFVMFLSFAIADTAWAVFFYALHLPSRLPVVAGVVAGSYSFGFLSGTIGLLQSCTSLRATFAKPLTAIVVAITTPIVFRFLLIPFFESLHGPFWTVFNVGEVVAITSSYGLLTVGLVVLISTRQLFWSFFTSGVASVVFADWAMRVEKIQGTSPAFGFYEFFWTFGIFIFAMPFLLRQRVQDKVEAFELASLTGIAKCAGLALVFLSIVVLSLSRSSELSAVKFLSLGCGIGAVITALAAHLFARRVQASAEQLALVVSQELDAQNGLAQTEQNLPSELRAVFRDVFQKRLEESHANRLRDEELKLAKTKNDVARQVAHDIRSPLAALQVLEGDASSMEERRRLLLRSAVQRVRDIANNLVEATLHTDRDAQEASDNRRAMLLASAIDSVVSERRFQERSRLDLQWRFSPGEESYGLFSAATPSDWKRALSNILVNAAEAIAGPGTIEIDLRSCGGFAEVCVSDTGRGIPESLLRNLGEEVVTSGKKGGNGLGVYHATRYLRSQGGDLTFERNGSKGTRVRMKLPLCAAPGWFLDAVPLESQPRVVVFDDDASIHEVWKSRLGGYPTIHFASVNAFTDWFQSQDRDSAIRNTVFLLDFELLGTQTNGLEIARRLQICAQTILVTSRFEEEAVLRECAALNIRLLPKSMAPLVPIRFPASIASRDNSAAMDRNLEWN